MRSDWSIAHIRSERTIDTSSMMMALELAHEPAVAAAADVVGADEPGRKAEEGVDGLAADVDCREPRGRQHHGLLR